MLTSESPYAGLPITEWLEKTRELVAKHPLSPSQLVDITLWAWREIFATKIGSAGYQIGKDIFPQPQIVGFLLHELIPLHIAREFSGWRRDTGGTEKDIVFDPDPFYSIEIKTSSDPRYIFGNRSYAQVGSRPRRLKDGYLLAVNFQGFRITSRPEIVRVRFGWIDHTDWVGQMAATGQQARLTKDADAYKLVDIL